MAREGLLEPRRKIRVCGALRPDVEMRRWTTRSVRARLRGGVLRGVQQRVPARLASRWGTAGADYGGPQVLQAKRAVPSVQQARSEDRAKRESGVHRLDDDCNDSLPDRVSGSVVS